MPSQEVCKSALKPIVFIEKVVGIDCGFETFTLIVGFGIIFALQIKSHKLAYKLG